MVLAYAMVAVGLPTLNLDASRFNNLHSLELCGVVRTWAPEASLESCSSVLAFTELFSDAPAVDRVDIGVSIMWQLSEDLTAPHTEILEEMPERATSDFALEMLYDMPWWRLEALLRYPNLGCVVVTIYKSCDDWYAPDDYTIPITNHIPWPPNSQEVQVYINWEFSEDFLREDAEYIVAV